MNQPTSQNGRITKELIYGVHTKKLKRIPDERGGLMEMLVQTPPLVYHGFKGIGPETAVILNVPTEVCRYEEPDEYRLEPHDGSLSYDCSRKDGWSGNRFT